MTTLCDSLHAAACSSETSALRELCHGQLPLDGRLEHWMVDLLAHQPEAVYKAVAEFGSPVNLIATSPFRRNLAHLHQAAASHDISFKVFFARKANKCLSFVDAGAGFSAGMDVASEAECRQVLDRGLSGSDIVCTAAIKTHELIRLCVDQGVRIVVDNFHELQQVAAISKAEKRAARTAVRLSGFLHEGRPLESRFGFDVSQVPELLDRLQQAELSGLDISGLHFHLDGYDAGQRISAIQQSLKLVDVFRERGHSIASLDMGGGFPMSYLADGGQWEHFWQQHELALLGQIEPITYRSHGLGRMVVDGKVHGRRNSYPYWQSPVFESWFDSILAASAPGGGRLSDAIRSRHLQLHCEPGRSLLDGCGMTVARVEFCKQHVSGDQLIGVAMNRTQCRTSSDDFLVDPILVPQPNSGGRSQSSDTSGFLVGAYCTESELLQLRRLKFPRGIGVGDLVVFPNTAGYLMHFLESRSHQYPLAKNLVYNGNGPSLFKLDPIDSKATP